MYPLIQIDLDWSKNLSVYKLSIKEDIPIVRTEIFEPMVSALKRFQCIYKYLTLNDTLKKGFTVGFNFPLIFKAMYLLC